MPKVTVSAHGELPLDSGGTRLPVATAVPLASASYGTTGATAALPDETRFVRIATDTAIHVRRRGVGADANDDMMPANSIEFFAAREGVIVSWIPA